MKEILPKISSNIIKYIDLDVGIDYIKGATMVAQKYGIVHKISDIQIDNEVVRSIPKYLGIFIYKPKLTYRCHFCKLKVTGFILYRSCVEEYSKMYPVAESGKFYKLFNIDHIVPKSMGGDNNYYNLRLTCVRCNSVRQSDMNIQDSMFLIKYYLIRTLIKIRRSIKKCQFQ